MERDIESSIRFDTFALRTYYNNITNFGEWPKKQEQNIKYLDSKQIYEMENNDNKTKIPNNYNHYNKYYYGNINRFNNSNNSNFINGANNSMNNNMSDNMCNNMNNLNDSVNNGMKLSFIIVLIMAWILI